MRRIRLLAVLLALGALLSACATVPKFDTAGVDKALTPPQAAADIAAARGRKVMWGGVILSSQNLKTRTQLEVLAYSLDGDGRPEGGGGPLGRFLIERPGYLETADYAPGRLVTVVGTVTRTLEGKVGEARYTYAVVVPAQLHLWPKPRTGPANPQVHFGIGVIFGN